MDSMSNPYLAGTSDGPTAGSGDSAPGAGPETLVRYLTSC